MARSTTVWAAALMLASMSGSGNILTTAEAMPAPGPQQTAERPRYYFPRQVKRQIVTNSTAPPIATESSTSSSSTSDIESRQTRDLPSFWESLFSSNRASDSSSSSVIIDVPTTTAATVESTTPPIPNLPIIGTGDLSSTSELPPPPPRPSSSTLAEEIFPPSQEPSPTPSETPTPSDVGTTPGFPTRPIEPTSAPAQSSTSEEEPQLPPPILTASSGGLPSEIILPTGSGITVPGPALPTTTLAQSSAPEEEPLPSSTSLVAAFPTAPSETPSETPVAPSSSSRGILPPIIPLPSTGGIIPSVLPLPTTSDVVPSATPEPSETPEPSQTPQPATSDPLPPILPLPSTGGIIPSILPLPSTGGVIPSELPLPSPSQASTGVLPPIIVLPTTSAEPSEPIPLPTSTGILVGITTALGTGESNAPTPTPLIPLPIPTSESKSDPFGFPLLSTSLEPSGVSNPVPGPTAPTTTEGIIPILPTQISSAVSQIQSNVDSLVSSAASELPTPIPDLPSIISSIASSVATDLPSLVSSSFVAPTGTAPVPSDPIGPILSSIQSSLETAISTLLPTPTTDIVPTSVPSGITGPATGPATGVPLTTETSIDLPLPSETRSSPSVPTTDVPTLIPSTTSGVLPPTPTGSGITLPPTGGSTIQTDLPTSLPSSIPTSEEPVSSLPTVSTDLPTIVPTLSSNGTIDLPTGPTTTNPTAPITTGSVDVTTSVPTLAPSETPSSSSLVISFTPPSSLPSRPTSLPPVSVIPTATNTETTFAVGSTAIIAEPTDSPSPSPVATTIPSELPKMITPPGGLQKADPSKFAGQIGFKWPLNYPFIVKSDGGNQIFNYLPIAIADALNITREEVVMLGLKPYDTLQYSGFITTLALFQIPSDLVNNMKNQLRTPTDPFWNNEQQIVNQLTELINTAIPLEGGPISGDGTQTAPGSPEASSSNAVENGGAMGGDIGGSRKVNPTSAGIATGAVMGAIAYGAAMFFVARRYRNKKMRHQRTSSVPSTSRYTYGSMQHTGGAFMSGGRGPGGRNTPGGRDSRGSNNSSSSNGRSVRTQQISAPVMAENSLGWN